MLYRLGVVLIVSYFLGNLNGAILISTLVRKEDIREKGSGNAGLTNFYRNYGGVQTLIVLLIDVFKSVAACLIGQWLLKGTAIAPYGRMFAGVAVQLGHVFPVLYRFHGGKGVLCSAAVVGMVDFRIFLIGISVFILVLLLTRYVSLGSLCALLTCQILLTVLYWKSWGIVLGAWMLGTLAIYMHRSNVARLLNGTESKFSLHHKS